MLAIGLGFSFAQSNQCDSNYTPTYELQGSERRSPFVGKIVSTKGVVTAVYPGKESLGGFFVQDLNGDGDTATSDGVFVRITKRSDYVDMDINIGDLVFVTGKMLERNELSQIDRLEALEICGQAEVKASELSLPLSSLSELEQYEGMRVKINQELSVAETYNLARYGQVLLSLGRLYQPNNGQTKADNALIQILLDDTSNIENPETVPYLNDDDYLRLGSTISGIEGVIVNGGLGKYRLEPIQVDSVKFTNSNPRTAKPDSYAHEISISSFNVLNYFTDLNERGADSPEEFERQTDKLLAALSSIDADVFGLIEIENDGNKTIAALTKSLNEYLGAEVYAYVPKPPLGLGTDQIRQAIMYKPAKLKLITYGSERKAIYNRPPVFASFKSVTDGEVFTVIVSHFKSKGGCPPGGDTDKGNGCWNLRRSAQAQTLSDFAAKISERINDTDVLLIGDLNSYRLETPIQVLESNNYTNIDIMLPLEDRYSYVFKGELGTLDYALVSESLLPQVSGFDVWHINSDEARMLDYNTEYNPAYLYQASPYRSSDHDPAIIYLNLE